MKQTPLRKVKYAKAELKSMRQTAIRKVSTKRQGQLQEYFDLIKNLMWLSHCGSEWSGDNMHTYGLEPHHIDGRTGARLLDPFNIILLTPEQHRTFQAHNSWEVRQALKLWVRGLRIAQGFVEC